MIDQFQDLRERIKKANKKQVLTRCCLQADAEGARKIIKENNEIHCMEVHPRLFGDGCDEIFYTIENDDDLKQEARKTLLNNFGIGI